MTPYQKSVLATVLVGVALEQLITISLALGWIGGLSPAARARARVVHRSGGLVALTIAVVITYYCLKLWPYSARTARVWTHATIGTLLLGLLVAKVTICNAFKKYYSWLPPLGIMLFIAVLLQWLVSAGWYFFYFSPGY